MKDLCRQVREDVLRIAKVSGHGHIPSCYSVIEILYAVYDTMRHDPKDPGWDGRDIFILSKGHASLAHYCILARLGYFDIHRVHAFGVAESQFGGHADRLKVPGVEASTGSLGHGIGIAVGMALAFKISKAFRRVFVVIGDGESNEGSVWEALMVANNLKLDNLIVIYDNNMSHARGLQITNPAEKLSAFGCSVEEVDGHNVAAIKRALVTKTDFVRAVVAHTKKGFGCKTLACDPYNWHRKSPSESEFERLMEELDEEAI
jgi:transketolase